jgi:hypothetical protein
MYLVLDSSLWQLGAMMTMAVVAVWVNRRRRKDTWGSTGISS